MQFFRSFGVLPGFYRKLYCFTEFDRGSGVQEVLPVKNESDTNERSGKLAHEEMKGRNGNQHRQCNVEW